MKVSIVIPAFNEEHYLEACLECLMKQSETPDEIIVVDNNSTDKTREIAKKFPVRLLTEKIQGATHARNTGFDAAKFDIIGRIDADTRIPRSWVENLKKCFESDPQLVAYSGSTIFEDKRFNKIFAFPEKMFIASFRKIIGGDLLYGPNMAIRKSAWQKVREYVCPDDKIVHEDLDLAIHLHELSLGKVVFNTNFQVTASERRWKKVTPYIEYPYRYLRTVQHHKQSLHSIKDTTAMIGKIVPKSKRIIRKIRTASASTKMAKFFTS